ncbi:hemoblobin-interacting domain-containing protein [Bdellovibrio reynosensis]|uniref:DUF1533 domain-containing protein n=1 Tax=Bdellovibrio reynosensis TaxID=2835041 RepID=A0ABY4CBT4_9BACT|nr:hemoblobin-interacting domain-containing protein [Bdellovibrio reynosensis]UOF02370.1 DUF1533 domain-containing protein [Bdellovibrio reynosensis]
MKTHIAFVVLALCLSLFFQNCAPSNPEEDATEVLTPASLTAEQPAQSNASNLPAASSSSAVSTSMSSSTSPGAVDSTVASSSLSDPNSVKETPEGSTSQGNLVVSNDSKSSDSDKTNKDGLSSKDSGATTNAPAPIKKTDSFNVEITSRSVDMVWVVDNSGGMAASAEILRKNFGPFAKDLAKKSDLRIALITRYGTSGTGISFSAELKNAVQVSHNVQSSEPLLLAAVAMCGIQTNDAFCSSFAGGKYQEVFGSLKSFLRPGSEKVFVFVSDDDSTGTAVNENKTFITAATFTQRMLMAFPTDSGFKTYGIISGSSTCGVQKGTAYLSLVKETAGLAFDICATDWSAYFSRLTSDLSQEVANSFLIDKSAKEIVSITLNGKTLSPADYNFSVGKITIDSDLLKAAGKYIVDISYLN